MRKFKNILVTGGAGFIGSHLLNLMVVKYPTYNFINLDSLTYASNLDNLKQIEGKSNYLFIHGDIRDYKLNKEIFNKYKIDCVLHYAAETHVDKSILNPSLFLDTNVHGTVNLLQIASETWKGKKNVLFYFGSTDEVYGSLAPGKLSSEVSNHIPRNPYAASKSGAEQFIKAYSNTFDLPFIISNSSNNYGPYQYPDKLVPLLIKKVLHNKILPLHGDGKQERDWLWVKDHCIAIDKLLHFGKLNHSYCIGGNNVYTNEEVAFYICDMMEKKLDKNKGYFRKLIRNVKDRKGNDRRYAVDTSKLYKHLNWIPSTNFRDGLQLTISWYLEKSSVFQ